MSKTSHQVFKRIVVHNKLMSEEEVDDLLAEVDDPERAIQRLVEQKHLPEKKAAQFLAVYQKKLDQLLADELDFLDDPAPTSTQAANEPESESRSDWDDDPPVPPETSTAKSSFEATGELRPLPTAGSELLHELLRAGREMGASDLHLKAGMSPIVRLHGELQEMPYPPVGAEACRDSMLAVLNDEQREQFLTHQDLDFCYDAGDLGRFRTNYLVQHRGLNGIFRMIPNQVPDFGALGLPDQIRKFTEYRVGVVLVTGPKGCGKTTTLAAMVDTINAKRAEHIITVEDPIEFVHPCKAGHVNQRQVGVHTKSFSNALRSALREAPDVIMVGEMRDLETTSLAITAAETGHLVLATLHTPDAIRTIGRVLDVFPPKEQPQVRAMLSESLRGIVSQLLLPSADGKSMELAVEILVNTQAIGHLIREEKVHQIRGLMQTGKQHGMILMDESLIRLAKEGRISKEVALSRAEDVKMVRSALGMN